MNKTVYKVGFRAGMIAFTATLAFFIAQILQILKVFNYPWGRNIHIRL